MDWPPRMSKKRLGTAHLRPSCFRMWSMPNSALPMGGASSDSSKTVSSNSSMPLRYVILPCGLYSKGIIWSKRPDFLMCLLQGEATLNLCYCDCFGYLLSLAEENCIISVGYHRSFWSVNLDCICNHALFCPSAWESLILPVNARFCVKVQILPGNANCVAWNCPTLPDAFKQHINLFSASATLCKHTKGQGNFLKVWDMRWEDLPEKFWTPATLKELPVCSIFGFFRKKNRAATPVSISGWGVLPEMFCPLFPHSNGVLSRGDSLTGSIRNTKAEEIDSRSSKQGWRKLTCKFVEQPALSVSNHAGMADCHWFDMAEPISQEFPPKLLQKSLKQQFRTERFMTGTSFELTQQNRSAEGFELSDFPFAIRTKNRHTVQLQHKGLHPLCLTKVYCPETPIKLENVLVLVTHLLSTCNMWINGVFYSSMMGFVQPLGGKMMARQRISGPPKLLL